MLSTMQEVPLNISRILEHGRRVHGKSTVTTWTGGGEPHRRTFAEIGNRASKLAYALRDELGVEPGSVLATLMCSSAGKTLAV